MLNFGKMIIKKGFIDFVKKRMWCINVFLCLIGIGCFKKVWILIYKIELFIYYMNVDYLRLFNLMVYLVYFFLKG